MCEHTCVARDVNQTGEGADRRPVGSPIASALRAVHLAERRVGEALAGEVGLGPTDFEALGHLLEDGPVGPTELGRRQGLSSAAATALADRLEAAGHVERTRHPHDRRRLILAPTQHASDELFERLLPLIAEVEAVASTYTPEEQAAIARFLREIAAVYARRSGDAPPAG